mgnify:CR=1 FL=1
MERKLFYYSFHPLIFVPLYSVRVTRTSKAMQTTAIGTVAYSLPENEVIPITLLISRRYIPYTDLHKKNCYIVHYLQISTIRHHSGNQNGYSNRVIYGYYFICKLTNSTNSWGREQLKTYFLLLVRTRIKLFNSVAYIV